MSDTQEAFQAAEELVKDCGFTSLPIQPKQIAIKYGIKVDPMPASSDGGVSGMLIRVGENYGILYATHIDNQGFQKFSISHELGHYFLPGHIDAVTRGGVHQTYSKHRSGDRYEREADEFATGLLMPGFLFIPQVQKATLGFDGIQELSELCGTSLTSTAIQYVKSSTDPLAIVVSRNDLIDYAFLSEELREYPGVHHLKKNSPLPNTLTKDFNSDRTNVLDARRKDGVSDFQSWFDSPIQGTFSEEVVGLGDYGRTLTILTASDLPTLEDIEEEADLLESWTPQFKR